MTRLPELPPLTLPEGEIGWELPGMLGDLLHLDELVPVWLIGRGRELWYVQVRGIVKPEPGWLPALRASTDQRRIYQDARDVRDYLLTRAELAIATVEDAGWLHESYPVIETTGRIRRPGPRERPGTPDRVEMARCEVRMELRR